jgi:hypothetical protein
MDDINLYDELGNYIGPDLNVVNILWLFEFIFEFY